MATGWAAGTGPVSELCLGQELGPCSVHLMVVVTDGCWAMGMAVPLAEALAQWTASYWEQE